MEAQSQQHERLARKCEAKKYASRFGVKLAGIRLGPTL